MPIIAMVALATPDAPGSMISTIARTDAAWMVAAPLCAHPNLKHVPTVSVAQERLHPDNTSGRHLQVPLESASSHVTMDLRTLHVIKASRPQIPRTGTILLSAHLSQCAGQRVHVPNVFKAEPVLGLRVAAMIAAASTTFLRMWHVLKARTTLQPKPAMVVQVSYFTWLILINLEVLFRSLF